MTSAIRGGGALALRAPECRAILDSVIFAVASGSCRQVTAGGALESPRSLQAIPHQPSAVSNRQYAPCFMRPLPRPSALQDVPQVSLSSQPTMIIPHTKFAACPLDPGIGILYNGAFAALFGQSTKRADCRGLHKRALPPVIPQYPNTSVAVLEIASFAVNRVFACSEAGNYRDIPVCSDLHVRKLQRFSLYAPVSERLNAIS